MHTALLLATLLSQAPRPLELRLQSLPPPAPGGASLLAPVEATEAYLPPVTRWVRIPVMALGGLALGTAGAVGGVMLPSRMSNEGPTLQQVALGGGGALLGASLGVWGPSALMGGRGSFGWTFLGAAAGMGAGASLVFAGVHSGSDVLANASLWTSAALPVVGAILGHELSAPRAPQDIQVIPSLAVGADGAQAGLSGRF